MSLYAELLKLTGLQTQLFASAIEYNFWEATPILSDELLDAYGEFYQNNDVPVPFIMFCKMPRYFGFE